MEDKEPTYLEVLAKQDGWNQKHFMSMMSIFGVPQSYADFGCGTGAMVKLAHQMGMDTIGYDVHEYVEPWYKKQDLTMRMKPGKAYQLVTCLEVAEHIQGTYTGLFLDNIAKHVQKGNGMLIFTAAPPGQAGEGHVNLRDSFYWRDQFHNREIEYQIELTTQLALLWSNINSPLYWLPANVQVFRG